MKNISRRKMLGLTGMAAGGVISAGPLQSYSSEKKAKKLKILITGAHPDDPETGCGGSILKFTEQGHDVVALYLTRGEAGIPGTSYKKAAKIRTDEAKKACDILHAKPVFAGQVDGNTEITKEHYKTVKDLIKKEDPDLVFTHWPIDSHRDHRITSTLVYDAWLELGRKFDLLYYEVLTGEQSQNFNPDLYIDISSVEKKKEKACLCHQSQNPEEVYAYHKKMSSFRGLEFNCTHAEAFIAHVQNRKRSFL
jgi:LmbE family N-acetylglucosaminyl deacetylase